MTSELISKAMRAARHLSWKTSALLVLLKLWWPESTKSCRGSKRLLHKSLWPPLPPKLDYLCTTSRSSTERSTRQWTIKKLQLWRQSTKKAPRKEAASTSQVYEWKCSEREGHKKKKKSVSKDEQGKGNLGDSTMKTTVNKAKQEKGFNYKENDSSQRGSRRKEAASTTQVYRWKWSERGGHNGEEEETSQQRWAGKGKLGGPTTKTTVNKAKKEKDLTSKKTTEAKEDQENKEEMKEKAEKRVAKRKSSTEGEGLVVKRGKVIGDN